jgi:hypothetical protein
VVFRNYLTMLVEDLARVFGVAQAALQARTGDVTNYNTHANTVRAGASELIRGSRYASLPQKWKDLFEASRFAPASPERLGKMLLAALPADPQRAISSAELNGDSDTYRSARNAMNTFSSGLRRLEHQADGPGCRQGAFSAQF